MHDRALETLQLVNTALWLAKPSSLNYPIIVTFDESVSPVSWRNCSVLWGRLAAHKEYMNHKLKSSDFKLASSLLKRIVGVKRPSAVWVALYSLWTALIDKTWEVRYLFFWIALEGLFGPDDSREMTFRLSQRLALFLGTNPVESLRLFNDAKRSYGWRSKVTHGIRLDKLKSETADTILFEAEICVRKALVKILQDDDLVDAFTSRRREEYLDGLPFSNKWRHDFA
ncbi:MAG: hypothetical protein KAV87_09270 [Desulfobacteraceae bacterium]|nr:hypothetical protein [Desulfobacteraceae bacterium]